MSISDYIEIKPEFTVDKFIDEAAPTANTGSFVKLNNYIPGRGYIATRLGINVLKHTPDTSWVMPWDPGNPIFSGMHTVTPSESEWARCRVILTFESQEKPGLNLLTGNNLYNRYWGYGTAEASMVTSYYGAPQGTHALYVGDSTAIKSAEYQGRSSSTKYGLWTPIPHADSMWYAMPGQSGVDTTTCLVTFWCYIPAHVKTGSHYFFTFGNYSGVPKNCFYARYYRSAGGSIKYQSLFCNHLGGAVNIVDAKFAPNQSGFLTAGVWHLLAFWVDGEKKSTGFYHYRADTKYEHWVITPLPGKIKLYSTSARQTIGPNAMWNAGQSGQTTDASNQILAAFDYWTMWDKLYTNYTSNITLCRNIKNLHAWKV